MYCLLIFYQEIRHRLNNLTGSTIKLFIQPDQNRCNQVEIRKYLEVFFNTNPEMRILESGTFQYDAQKCVIKYALLVQLIVTEQVVILSM